MPPPLTNGLGQPSSRTPRDPAPCLRYGASLMEPFFSMANATPETIAKD
jgi:hypothetical protein